MRVEFSELAEAGIRKLVQDESRYHGLKSGIAWYVARHPQRPATPCPAFPDRAMFLFPLGGNFRVLYEVREFALVWSVLPARDAG